MSSSRQTDLSVLHPAIRDRIAAIEAQLNDEGHPFAVFEAFRSPQRQAFLYAQGRTRPGRKVTNARPWSSYHQYGLAADFVLKINGNWSWSTSGDNGRSWARLHEVAIANGLEPLSWELPHIQLAGIDIGDLRAGRHPDGGDEAWADHLSESMIGWQGAPPAPPAPVGSILRPALPDGAMAHEPATTNGETGIMTAEEDLTRPAVPAAAGAASAGAGNFAVAHAFVAKWEGGFVDHPSDPGGATNMGITIATLSRWRQRPVTKAEVRALTEAEAQQIFKAFYFDVIRGESLPLPVAMVAYNGAVLHGPGRSAKFLQRGLNGQGIAVAVDGAVGPETLGGVARSEPARLTADFLNIQERFLRGLPHFPTFGTGWMNRLNDLRQTIAGLGTIVVPPPTGPLPAPHPQPQPEPSTSGLAGLLGRIGELAELLRRSRERPRGLQTEAETPESAADDKELLKIVAALLAGIEAIETGDGTGAAEPALTPVNAALGEPIGKLLDGKKTAIGIVGTLLTAILAPAASGADPGTLLGTVGSALPVAQPVTLALTAWGVLGKIDKWVRSIRGAAG